MSKTYEVTWIRSGMDDFPTDEFPFNVEVEDFFLVKATTRREVWRYTVDDSQTYRLETGLDRADSCLRYRTVK